MWAADRGNGSVVRMLLEHGADKTLISSSGQKAVDVALIAGHKDVAALLDLNLKPPATMAEAELTADPVVAVTELETVLMGLDLTCLLPKFYEHKMDYDALLLINDQDLDRMNITEASLIFSPPAVRSIGTY